MQKLQYEQINDTNSNIGISNFDVKRSFSCKNAIFNNNHNNNTINGFLSIPLMDHYNNCFDCGN